MERLLQGIPGVVPYFDDVLVSAASVTELGNRLRAVLQKFRGAGLKVKQEKCTIGAPAVEFLGYKIDGAGIHPTETKVRAIREAPAPRNKSELQAFLGLLNFYALFLEGKATVAEPLHRLLAKNTPWVWGKAEGTAFTKVKSLLSNSSFIIQYNSTLPVVLVCDASPFGVGAVLSHRLPNGLEAPIAYYSRTLSSAERNYSQLDREALAMVAGVKKFHEYLFGRPFELVTDHRPLLGILASDRQSPAALSPRMTRWAIFLSGYSYRLVHRPGKDMGNADALSRCPLPDELEDPVPEAPVLLVDIVQSSPVTSAEVARASAKDPLIRTVMGWASRGWPSDNVGELYQPFASRKNELTCMGGCLVWGDRVVIPAALRDRVLVLLHKGHPGIVRMKGLARSYVWWPGLDKDITTWVGTCRICQDSRPNPPVAKPREWEKPQGPWSRIHIDFAGPFHGQMFLVVVDALSKWLEIILMKSTTAEATIRVLRQLFSTHGLPDVVVSDNGPQFTATVFEGYLADLGVRHVLSAPFHPSNNGLAERFVRSAKEALSRLSPGDWQERIDLFLAAQHATPCPTTGRSPAEVLMGRKHRCLLDRLHPTYSPDSLMEGKGRSREFLEGTPVFARNYGTGPTWEAGVITEVTGPRSYRVELGDGRIWRRHIDQLRKRIQSEAPGSTENPNFTPQLNPDSIPTETAFVPEDPGLQRCQNNEPPASRSSPNDEAPKGPRAEQGETGSPSDLLDAAPPSELRRSTRVRTRPGHLRDYVCKF